MANSNLVAAQIERLLRDSEPQTPFKGIQSRLIVASQIERSNAVDVFHTLSPDSAAIILERINVLRARLSAAPLEWKTPRKVLSDFQKLVTSEAFRHSKELGRTMDPQRGFRLWQRWITSPAFRKGSQDNPAFDECADLFLGLDERELQRKLRREKLPYLYRKENTYLQLTPEELFTPYHVLIDLVSTLPHASTVRLTDLGCGLGRVGFVLLALRRKVQFLGYEMVSARAEAARQTARRLGLENRFLVETRNLAADLRSYPPAQFYFLFNPFSPKTLTQVLARIRENAPPGSRVISVIHGSPHSVLKRARWVAPEGRPKRYPHWPGRGYQVFRVR